MRDIDRIRLGVQRAVPDVTFDQLQVTHPGDDDGLWFLGLPQVPNAIQLESGTGNCPFLVETDAHSSAQAYTAHTVDDAIAMVVTYFQSLHRG